MSTFVVLTALVAAAAPAAALLQFQDLKPATGDERFNPRTAYSAAYEGGFYGDGNVVGLGFQPWARTGDKIGNSKHAFGAYVGSTGRELDSPTPTPPATAFVSNYPDFTSILNFHTNTTIMYDNQYYFNSTTGEVDGPFTVPITANILYSITHMESGYPSSAYLTKLHQEAVNGSITAVWTKPLDFSAYRGLLNPCAGSVTQWMTHLGSEENDPDAKKYSAKAILAGYNDRLMQSMMLYQGYGYYSANRAAKKFNPYLYGHIWEATVDPVTEASHVVKHYAMGRASFEMAKVMPDRKTAYLSVDSGNGRPHFMFVADTPGDLSAGTLYAMKATQTSPVNGAAIDASFDITWIELGHSTDDEIKMMVNGGIQFAQIFTSTAPTCTNTGCTCASGRLTPGLGSAPDCLELKTGMETAAAFLESTRYAGYMGATTEWTKWEGLTHDTRRHINYFSLTEIDGPMLNRVTDGTTNDIKLAQNVCGCVMKMILDPTTFQATQITALTCGSVNRKFTPTAYITKTPFTYYGPMGKAFTAYSYNLNGSATPAYNSTDDLNLNVNNVCSLNGLSNPDNLAYVPGHDGIFIGEDTSLHQNDMMWYYDLNAVQFSNSPLTRIFTAPFGSEVTSVYYYPNVNGWAYIVNVVQHPYTEDSTAKLSVQPQAAAGFQGYVGYIGHNLAYQYYIEVGQVGGLPRFGDLCPQGAPSYSGCNDRNPCTVDSCVNVQPYYWTCEHDPIVPCVLCNRTNAATVCDDGNGCTFDQCVNGGCQNTLFDPTCQVCGPGAPCDDGNTCTADECIDFNGNPTAGQGICNYYQPYGSQFSGCATCTDKNATAACNDSNTCTVDYCDTGVCVNLSPPEAPAANCTQCTSTSQCNDNNTCTIDLCDTSVDPKNVQGVCTFAFQLDGTPCTGGQCIQGVCQ